jgi:hypothetical protein
MKRKRLSLDENLLHEISRVSGEKTMSRAVELALQEYLRHHQARRILELAGSGLWDGNLSEMRRDQPPGLSR